MSKKNYIIQLSGSDVSNTKGNNNIKLATVSNYIINAGDDSKNTNIENNIYSKKTSASKYVITTYNNASYNTNVEIKPQANNNSKLNYTITVGDNTAYSYNDIHSKSSDNISNYLINVGEQADLSYTSKNKKGNASASNIVLWLKDPVSISVNAPEVMEVYDDGIVVYNYTNTSYAAVQDLKVEYTVDNPKIATIDNSGQLTALQEGTVKITVAVYMPETQVVIASQTAVVEIVQVSEGFDYTFDFLLS